MKYAMPKMFTSALVGTMFLAGSALAGDVLSERQLDSITAGANITTIQLAVALSTYDITTNADHDVNVEANTTTVTNATVVFDASAVGNSGSQSVLNTSTANN